MEAVLELLGEAGKEAGFNPNVLNDIGESALHVAVQNGKTEIVKELLGDAKKSFGFSLVNVLDQKKQSALSVAIATD